MGPGLLKSKIQLYPGERKSPFFYIVHSGSHVLKVDFKFALVWVVYAVVILKVKPALFLERTRTDIEDLHIFFGVCFRLIDILAPSGIQFPLPTRLSR